MVPNTIIILFSIATVFGVLAVVADPLQRWADEKQKVQAQRKLVRRV